VSTTSHERLIVFTRYPEPGRTKTRLIPAMGAEGAADLQRRMTERMLCGLDPLLQSTPFHIEIRFDGGNKTLMKQWLGSDYNYVSQGRGKLGQRMESALISGFASGASSVVIVGTDIPGITDNTIRGAFDALKQTDVVFGPAVDGGYYLIGLQKKSVNQALPNLLADMPWGTQRVMDLSKKRAADLGLSMAMMPTLADVDRPEDISVWEQLTGVSICQEDRHRISVIIPALNEADNIAETVLRARKAGNIEVIVVDGGSQDGTVDIARSAGAVVMTESPPRARQMNAGAAVSSGSYLLFLHADTILPLGYDAHIRRSLAAPHVALGAFQLRIDASHRALRIMEVVANWRTRFLKMPYGDQALFMSAAAYQSVGGFPLLPIMEDFEMVRRLGNKGQIVTLSVPVLTSARRWIKLGIWRTWVINQVVIAAYQLGIPPRVLARLYRGRGH
jgi:rSAM/selenodomain-associated transferase 2/rSAM/selenodomain-associated transferase 1